MIETGVAALDVLAARARAIRATRDPLGGRPRGDAARDRADALLPDRARRAGGRPLQSEGGLAALRLRGRVPSRRAATSIAASTISRGSEGGGAMAATIRSERRQRRRGHRHRRRRRHARATSWPRRASTSSRSRPAGAICPRTTSTTSGRASASSPGRTRAPPRGDWRVAQDFPGLPAWIVKAVGGSTVHWAGASLRFQDHEWKARTDLRRHAGREPARLADRRRRDGAVLRPGRGQDGRDPHRRPAGTAGQQQLQGDEGRRRQASATRIATPAAWRSTRSTATTGRPASRPASASRAASGAPSGRPPTPRFPKGEATGNLEVRDECHRAA